MLKLINANFIFKISEYDINEKILLNIFSFTIDEMKA